MTRIREVTLLDVTLRDGGYQNHWNFQQEHAVEIVRLLLGAGVDHVEIGYRNSPPNESRVGLTGRVPNEYIAAIREAAPAAKLAVMYAPGLVTDRDLEELAALGITMVRGGIPHRRPERAFPLIKRGRDLGMISTANIINVTQYRLENLLDLCRRIIDNGCSVIYLADSNGSMTPESVKSTFAYLQERLEPIQWGFHNHDMLGMGMANAIEAMHAGVSYIDCSIRGMGRSAGNVPTEALVTYMSRISSGERYRVRGALRAALYLGAHSDVADPKPEPLDTACGAYDFDSLVEPLILQAAAENQVPWYDLIAAMAAANLDKARITQVTLNEIAASLPRPAHGS
jgi:4-hydroxy 2-oxovalerate aldolase